MYATTLLNHRFSHKFVTVRPSSRSRSNSSRTIWQSIIVLGREVSSSQPHKDNNSNNNNNTKLATFIHTFVSIRRLSIFNGIGIDIKIDTTAAAIAAANAYRHLSSVRPTYYRGGNILFSVVLSQYLSVIVIVCVCVCVCVCACVFYFSLHHHTTPNQVLERPIRSQKTFDCFQIPTSFHNQSVIAIRYTVRYGTIQYANGTVRYENETIQNTNWYLIKHIGSIILLLLIHTTNVNIKFRPSKLDSYSRNRYIPTVHIYYHHQSVSHHESLGRFDRRRAGRLRPCC